MALLMSHSMTEYENSSDSVEYTDLVEVGSDLLEINGDILNTYILSVDGDIQVINDTGKWATILIECNGTPLVRSHQKCSF